VAYFPQTCSLNKPTWYAMKNLPRKKDQIYLLRNRRSDRGDDDLQPMFII